jgi:hypothetical protein
LGRRIEGPVRPPQRSVFRPGPSPWRGDGSAGAA